MDEHWVQECKVLLDHMKKLENLKGRDRLDMVRTIRFILLTLQRSVAGWNEWVNNPDMMANFPLEELKEISRNLAKLTEPFIEYDCEITSQAQKDLTVKEPETPEEPVKKAKEKSETFYVS
jgi:hypothetical protein